ncbi:MAG: FHA domain-containing protein, partial [Planctomycetaceae bacterium]
MSGISTAPANSRVSSRAHLRLTLQHGSAPAVSRQYDLLDGELLLGSAGICDLQVADAGMPPIHSILRAEENGWLLESLVSTPPLHINGRPLQTGRLRTGDRVELGSCAFTVAALEEG